MVPKAGLEPARISTVDFESTASTDFATSALQVVCGKRVHYTFQRSTCNTYPLFNELSAEKSADGVTFGWFYGRGMQRPHVFISARAPHQTTETKKAQPHGYAFFNCLQCRYLRFSSIYTLINKNSMLGSNAPSTGGMLYTRLSGPKIWSST